MSYLDENLALYQESETAKVRHGLRKITETLRGVVLDSELSPTGDPKIDGPKNKWLKGFMEAHQFVVGAEHADYVMEENTIYKKTKTGKALELTASQRYSYQIAYLFHTYFILISYPCSLLFTFIPLFHSYFILIPFLFHSYSIIISLLFHYYFIIISLLFHFLFSLPEPTRPWPTAGPPTTSTWTNG